MRMKAVNPLLFLLLFFNVISLVPVIATGLRIAGLWYTPWQRRASCDVHRPVSGVRRGMRRGECRRIQAPQEVGLGTIHTPEQQSEYGRSYAVSSATAPASAILLVFVPVYFLSYLVRYRPSAHTKREHQFLFHPRDRDILCSRRGAHARTACVQTLDLFVIGLVDVVLLSLALALRILSYAPVRLAERHGPRGSRVDTIDGDCAEPRAAFLRPRCRPRNVSGHMLSDPDWGELPSLPCLRLHLGPEQEGDIRLWHNSGSLWVTGVLQGLELFSTASPRHSSTRSFLLSGKESHENGGAEKGAYSGTRRHGDVLRTAFLSCLQAASVPRQSMNKETGFYQV